MESIESVNKILEEANKRILPVGTGMFSDKLEKTGLLYIHIYIMWLLIFLALGDLFGALKGRLHDSNKNLIMSTLSTIGALASAMGPPVEKSSKVLFCFSSSRFIKILMPNQMCLTFPSKN